MIVGGLRTSPNDTLNMHTNLLPFHLLVDKVQFQAALRLATLPKTHPSIKNWRTVPTKHKAVH